MAYLLLNSLLDLVVAIEVIVHLMAVLWPDNEKLASSLHSHHFSDHLLELLIYCYTNKIRLVDLIEDKIEFDMTKFKTAAQHHRWELFQLSFLCLRSLATIVPCKQK